MTDAGDPAVPRAPGRRAILAAAAFGTLALLSRSARDPWRLSGRLDGTFIQPWRDDLALSGTGWARKIADARAFGCPNLVLQWTRHGTDYALDADLIIRLMDLALAAGCRLQVGLPYDPDYWAVLEGRSPRPRPAFLDAAATEAARFLAAAPFARHPAFAGWYIPYELDQASWARPEEMALLAAFLTRLRQAGGASPMAISCFHSANAPDRTLVELWQALPADLALRPLVQDGVGMFGLANYRHLVPLFAYFRATGRAFDVVVELFAQKQSDLLEPGAFAADAADFVRLAAQLDVAAASGAEHLIAFALHPYMTGPASGAGALRTAYARALDQ
ncbi:DUF4434 domain-containing protein [Aquabacter sp. L1I39]|uniref:DUF4434 domain-containing protein n=1 Tax=Aquabacter sp. L1I39 TaxID=2820278 RepID=UPI001ADB0F47|nr:DUF4434 domain-containing protein [Aquabacter sp. L1I39]QTL02752.1 DUF4434 domain-containing protein [Aquabacter sp. L1I39]